MIGRWLAAYGLVLAIALAVLSMAGGGTPAVAFTTDGQEDICADPNVIFCENWEVNRTTSCLQNGTCAAKFKSPLLPNSGGEPAYICCPGNGSGAFTVDTTQSFDGTHSLRMQYPSCSRSDGSCGAGWLEWTIQPGNRTVFVRMYIRLDSTWNHSNIFFLKTLELDSSSNFGSGQDWFFPHFHETGSLAPNLAIVTDVHPDDEFPQNTNLPATSLVPGQWHCVEIQTTYNTGTNTNNGAILTWIDGVQKHNLPNLTIQNAGSHDTGFLRLTTSGFGVGGGTSPAQALFIDNIVVSKARIGCGTAQAGPGAPSALLLR